MLTEGLAGFCRRESGEHVVSEEKKSDREDRLQYQEDTSNLLLFAAGSKK